MAGMAKAGAMVVSAADLHRIQGSIGLSHSSSTGDLGAAKSTKDRAKELHEKSVARAKTWSNTLEGSRKKKADERARKLELEELARQQVDAEEAKIQLDARRATIERANKLLVDESDRMKTFHSCQMYADVLAEREAQVALKDELKKLEKVREDRFKEMEKQNYRKMLERELKERGTKEELAKIAAKAQKEQLAEYKEKRFREIEDEYLEGELLRRKAIEDLEAERNADQGRRDMAIQAMRETQKANEYLKQIKAEDALREAKEAQKITDYAHRKEKMLELRKQKEEEVFRAKLAERNKMIETQAARLAQMSNNEEERVANQVREKEESDERKRLEKEAMLNRWMDDIKTSQKAQVDRKRAQREKEKMEDVETAKFLGEWCKILDAQEQEEVDAKRAAAVKLQSDHKKMIEIRRRKEDESRRQDAEVAKHAKKALDADTDEFHTYAEKIIRGYSEEGKNVIPLIKELRAFKTRSAAL